MVNLVRLQPTPQPRNVTIMELYSHHSPRWLVGDQEVRLLSCGITTPPATRYSRPPPHPTIIIPITTNPPALRVTHQLRTHPRMGVEVWLRKDQRTNGKISTSCSTVFYKWLRRRREPSVFYKTELFIVKWRVVERRHPLPQLPLPGSEDPTTQQWIIQKISSVRRVKWWLKL